MRLRVHLKRFRQAKVTDKYFIMRRAWRIWVKKSEESGRERRLREWNKRRVGKLFASTSSPLTRREDVKD